MNVLVIKNVFSEGPGTMADHLRDRNIPFSVCDLSIGDQAPSLEPYSHLLIMGGPMAVYEMDRHRYLADEARIIEAGINANKCVLGVCLGAQMVAHVLGARVYAGGTKEIGWYDVTLSADGGHDRCMKGLSVDNQPVVNVFQWHGDTFDLPQGAVHLASSPLFPNQAFRYHDRVYALQFHIEVTPTIVRQWLSNETQVDWQPIVADSEKRYDAYRKRASLFYDQFFREL